MSNSSYAYAEVLDVLENMENIYVQKIPEKFISFLNDNASKDYKKHVVTTKPLENQNLNEKTLTILALINLKYWVESEEHKQELLKKYKENERKEIEKLSQHFDSSSIFENDKNASKTDNKNIISEESENANLPIERKSAFRRFVDFIKSKIFEN